MMRVLVALIALGLSGATLAGEAKEAPAAKKKVEPKKKAPAKAKGAAKKEAAPAPKKDEGC